ncbi:MAG TPA: choice-of-anchor B family protein [Rubricoccaceae bacterium]|jgi:choice-of-anchor B domain-containing protein
MPFRLAPALFALLLLAAPAARAQSDGLALAGDLAKSGVAEGETDDLTAIATPCVSGFAGVYACSGIDLSARLPLSSFTAGTSTAPTSAAEVWGWTDPQTGKEIALVGLSNGLGFVDVTVPDAPVYLGKLASATTGNNSWRTFRVYQNVVFVGSEAAGHGIQVFDLTRLRGVTTPTLFAADARYTGTTAQRVGNVHTLVINEQTGYLYAVGTGSCGGGGPHMVDIRTPLTPVFAGCVATDGYTHEAQALVYDGPDAQYVGRELLVMYQGQGSAQTGGQVSFFDVTNKAAPVRISTATYPNPGYSHQGWFTADRTRLLVDDEFDQSAPGSRTVVMDVTDLDNPGFLFNYNSAKRTYAHNLYVIGRYAYMSNYTSGLRIVDIQNMTPTGFREVASFDTYNQNDNYSYNGQWMNYPYFRSGTIVATDINNGFFVLRPTVLAVAGEAGAPDAAAGFALSSPAPNPATDQSRLVLTTDTPQRVRAALYDVTGREVSVLFDGTTDGETELTVRRDALAAGTYVVRVTGERGTATRRMVFAR